MLVLYLRLAILERSLRVSMEKAWKVASTSNGACEQSVWFGIGGCFDVGWVVRVGCLLCPSHPYKLYVGPVVFDSSVCPLSANVARCFTFSFYMLVMCVIAYCYSQDPTVVGLGGSS
jgi:hypothetical protein